MAKTIITEDTLNQTIEDYYSLEETDLFKLTQEFSNEQTFLISYLAGYQKELSETLFEELLDASIIIWKSFKHQLPELGIVEPNIVSKLEKKNDNMVRKLSKKLNIKDDQITLEKINQINQVLNSAKTGDELQNLLQDQGSEEIVNFISSLQSNTNQPVINNFATDTIPYHLEEDGFTDEEIQTVVEMLVFQMECYDLMLNQN